MGAAGRRGPGASEEGDAGPGGASLLSEPQPARGQGLWRCSGYHRLVQTTSDGSTSGAGTEGARAGSRRSVGDVRVVAVREQRPDILWKPSAPGLPL